jgi:hypothetical protein
MIRMAARVAPAPVSKMGSLALCGFIATGVAAFNAVAFWAVSDAEIRTESAIATMKRQRNVWKSIPANHRPPAHQISSMSYPCGLEVQTPLTAASIVPAASHRRS